MNDDSAVPATKADIALILSELRSMRGQVDQMNGRMDKLAAELTLLRRELDDFKVEVNLRFEAFEHRMDQTLLDAEGRIITSNYRLADSIQQRLGAAETSQAGFISRLAIIEARLLDIEKRLNIPPTAA